MHLSTCTRTAGLVYVHLGTLCDCLSNDSQNAMNIQVPIYEDRCEKIIQI
jgi:hypothetical protein